METKGSGKATLKVIYQGYQYVYRVFDFMVYTFLMDWKQEGEMSLITKYGPFLVKKKELTHHMKYDAIRSIKQYRQKRR